MARLVDCALELLSPGRRDVLEASDRAELAREHRDQVVEDEREKTDIRYRTSISPSVAAMARGIGELEEAERRGLGG